ncbi:MAG: isochorismate synthase [Acidimicrobiales bacterium]
MTLLSDTGTIAAGLVARTRRLDRTPDLLMEAGADGLLWSDEHGGLAGRGQALRVRLPDGLADTETVRAVGWLLRSITCDDAVGLPGCGPVAIGALAFDPAGAGELIVPARVVGYRGDDAWETVIAPGDAPAEGPGDSAPVTARPSLEAPDQFSLGALRPHREWLGVLASAVAHVQAGHLEKVVLARCVEVVANRPFVVPEVLARLVALYPSCMVFCVEGFIGASPELLLRREGTTVTSHPLAGTVARSGERAVDEALAAGLLASLKERREHRLVVDALSEALAPSCTSLEVPAHPSIVGLRNVSHLGTLITGHLPKGRDDLPSALELVARIHPTPAVGGSPTGAALAYLGEVEGFDRGRYAGPVGWVDARGDGAFAVGIRSADVDGPRARMYAGGGIVADSEPAAELVETQLKLQALLATLVRP